jgi:hypothetical protein
MESLDLVIETNVISSHLVIYYAIKDNIFSNLSIN